MGMDCIHSCKQMGICSRGKSIEHQHRCQPRACQGGEWCMGFCIQRLHGCMGCRLRRCILHCGRRCCILQCVVLHHRCLRDSMDRLQLQQLIQNQLHAWQQHEWDMGGGHM